MAEKGQYNLYSSNIKIHTFGENGNKKNLIISNEKNILSHEHFDTFFLDGIYDRLSDDVKSTIDRQHSKPIDIFEKGLHKTKIKKPIK